MKKLIEIFNYKDMIDGLVRKDLRGRYKGSVLGFIWNFINPLCQILVYYVVFSNVFNPDMEKFHIFLIAGIIPWNFFSESVVQGTGCIIANADMTKKIYFPRAVLPIATVTSRFINFLLSLAVCIVIIMLTGGHLSVSLIWWLPVLLLLEYFMALGFSFILSAINVYFRDVEYMTNVLMMIWIWLTPIMYSFEAVPEQLQKIVAINPMTPIITAYQSILYRTCDPKFQMLIYSIIFDSILLLVGIVIFEKLSDRFSEEL